jgi:hypothetical protein
MLGIHCSLQPVPQLVRYKATYFGSFLSTFTQTSPSLSRLSMSTGKKPKCGPGHLPKCYKSSGRHAAKQAQMDMSHCQISPPTPSEVPLGPSPSSLLLLTAEESLFAKVATQRPSVLRFLGEAAPSHNTSRLFLDKIPHKPPAWEFFGSVHTIELPYWFDMQVRIQLYCAICSLLSSFIR